jgi:c-di-GMP-binding flagellar brake protein YcgR
MLRGTQASPANRRAITVAILDSDNTDGQQALKNAFAMGAHFVLFKPLSLEKTKSSFRAVRALMKRERRRHTRIQVELPVDLFLEGSSGKLNTTTSDLGENGMAIRTKDFKLPSSFRLRFRLPGDEKYIECTGEVAWEAKVLQGVRFRNVSPEAQEQLKAWIARQSSGAEADETPVSCKLTDLSLNACYLQTDSPFPVRTRANLTMKVKNAELRVEGLVRVMHPGVGLGVEFTRQTASQQKQVEEFIQTLMSTEGAIPEIQVRPEGIEPAAADISAEKVVLENDPLLLLFRDKAEISSEVFQEELKKQRGVPQEVEV